MTDFAISTLPTQLPSLAQPLAIQPNRGNRTHLALRDTLLQVRVDRLNSVVPSVSVLVSDIESAKERVLFTTQGTSRRQRTLVDANNNSVYNLRRHIWRKEGAWQVFDPDNSAVDAEPVVSSRIRYTSTSSKFDLKFPGQSGDEILVQVRGQDASFRDSLVFIIGVEIPVMSVRRTRASERPPPQEKGKRNKYRPVWEAAVSEGFDLSLAALIVMMLADNFVEMQASMLLNPLTLPLLSRW